MASLPNGEGDLQLKTLEALSEAVHYNHWIYRMMEPYLGKRVLEVGCGIGNMAEMMAEGRQILAVDVHPGYLAEARRRLKGRKHVAFRRMDLEKGLLSARRFRPDTVLCVNVLEHLREDDGFLRDCSRLLPPGGRLLLFVPALPFLFGSLDEEYGHFRRYLKGGLEGQVQAAGFSIVAGRYLNLLGILGWWWNGKVLRKKSVPRAQILLYDRLLGWMAPVEKWLPRPAGLSLFCAARRKP